MLLNKRIPIKYLFQKIQTELLSLIILVLATTYINQYQTKLTIPLTAVTILGTLISLLLAFRTAQAYDRWWEGRKIWGKILSESRTLVREAQTFFKDPSKARSLALRQAAWNYELGDTLRGKRHFSQLKDYISKEEYAYVDQHMNTPNALLDMHGKQIREAFAAKEINEFQQIHLMNTVSEICDLMGMSERIKNTVFPKTYSTLLQMSIYLFAVMVPFGLQGFSFLTEATIAVTLSIAFFLVERTATYLQDPFENRETDVSVTAIARVIEINILDMLEDTEIPELLEDEGFFIK